MRLGLALVTGLALLATPALAQTKTKASAANEAVAALEVCETFARGGEGALDAAIAAGWDAYDEQGESPFIRQFSASRDIPVMGWGDIFVLVESYPDATLGYCRLDLMEPAGNGKAVIEALAALDRYEGEVVTESGAHYASLSGTGEDQSLLATHWDGESFVLQLTIITPKSASSEQ
ncbi:hypothetical protein [Devosia sediminis]|uniref:Uncharacterized protein n=1 Tax=Devosia sediminis TaxID=2798801 RepID=A0A934MIR2_9HYPH|nr:hypothetical protein [Devosia sediminis]MBJ3783228.1 hypothetical protein [Devosia sediminis]